MSITPSAVIRRITIHPDGCWTIAGWSAYGYTYVRYDGRDWRAHRLIYTLLIGPIPDGLTLDHLCGNKACVFPGHLEPVTSAENTRRYLDTIETCSKGHPLSGDNLKPVRTRPTLRRCRRCYNDERNRRRARQRVGVA